jgi:hypothetical protein
MICLYLDESYAFDYLTILYIKSKTNPSLIDQVNQCEKLLKQQINNNELWQKIITSEEFKYLSRINQEVFWAVDAARYGSISAKEVDAKNMQRYHAKKALQEKFFPSDPLTEYKT